MMTSIVALITPFSDGAVDEQAIRKLVDWHVEQGTHGIVPCGTTGESPTLSHDEHNRVVEIVIDLSQRINSVGHADTRDRAGICPQTRSEPGAPAHAG